MSAFQEAAPTTSAATLLPDWLSRRASVSPTRLALVAGDVRWTFAELHAEGARLARRLAGAGVGEGDRVATLLRNGVWPVLVLHALRRLGAVLVPLNWRLTPPELAWQVADCDASLLIADAANAARAAEAVAGRSGILMLGVGPGPNVPALNLATLPEADVPLRPQVDLGALQGIVYTSGTTGRPKGALLTYGNHWWSAVGSVLNLGLAAEDRLLACLPLFHVGGMAILFRSVLYGVTAVVHDGFDPAAVNRAIEAEGVTMVSVVAAMLQRMLEAQGDRPYPPTLRCMLLGGGPAPRPLLEACAHRGVPVVQTYGLTETASQAVTLAPEDALRKLGSAGKPLLPIELRIDINGREARPEETGEILLRGPSVSPGYWGEARAAIQHTDGWLRTGDLGWADEDGYLYVADRRDDLIISGGENVYPAEVEAALLAHPDVQEAGVVGVPDARWGQAPAAVVVPRAGAAVTEGGLLAFCAERLAGYKVPVRVRFEDALPRNAAGKLLRRQLRELEARR